ncbi:C6 zinc finger domain-containing protein, partial [Dactylonectria macrodidyma]
LASTNQPSTCFTIDDLALLHHWTLSTSLSIVNSPDVDHYWQEVFPQIAFRHPFVMHGILSLAALHPAYMHAATRQQLILIGTQHCILALQGFQEGIDAMGDDNSDALFVCTLLNFLYTFATFGPLCNDIEGDACSVDRKSRVLGAEWIPMIRGVEAVLHQVYDRVRLGPLCPLLSLGNWDSLDPNQQPVEDGQFRSREAIWAHSSDAETYDNTLYLLRKCNMYMRQFRTMDATALAQWGYNRAWSASFIWLHSAPDEYFVLLRQRQPPALLIFAYLGTLLHGLEGRWFMEGWGRNIVDVVGELLGEY